MRGTWIVAIGLAMSACGGGSQEAFVEAQAKTTCKATKKCARAAFLDAYRDMADCIDEQIDGGEDFLNALPEDCEYDPKEGRRCLATSKQFANTCLDADEIGDDCAEVFDCGDFSVGFGAGAGTGGNGNGDGNGNGNGNGNSGLTGSCAELAACCDALTGAAATACSDGVAAGTEAACSQALGFLPDC